LKTIKSYMQFMFSFLADSAEAWIYLCVGIMLQLGYEGMQLGFAGSKMSQADMINLVGITPFYAAAIIAMVLTAVNRIVTSLQTPEIHDEEPAAS